MKKFAGFPPGKQPLVQLPSQFFSELLPAIDDLDELKMTLYALWALQQQEETYRYLVLDEILRDATLKEAMTGSSTAAEERIRQALDRAVERGSLLHAHVEGPQGVADVYFLNSAKGRNAIQAIESGRFRPSGHNTPILLMPERPNIFTLYEQNIGPLTPLISDALRAAEEEYPSAWIAEAIQLAVERNARNWRYVEGILKRWHAEGKDGGPSKRTTKTDRYRYIQGEYSDTIDY